MSDAVAGHAALNAQAAETLALVERKVTYMVTQSWRAIEQLLGLEDQDPIDAPGSPRTPDLSRSPAPTHLTLPDLDRYARYWAGLVPGDPGVRAAFIHQLGARYRFEYAAIAGVRESLGLDSVTVHNAYQRLYAGPLEDAGLRLAEDAAAAISATEAVGADESPWPAFSSEFEWVFIPKSAALFVQGGPSDCLYVVISGRLSVIVDDAGLQQRVGEVTRGESVGEMGLITGALRSATVVAARDSELLRLSADGFRRLVDQHPNVMLSMTRLIIARLSRAIHQTRPQTTVTTITVAPLAAHLPTSEFVTRLRVALQQFGPTLHLTRETLDAQLGAGAADALDDGVDSNRVVSWLNDQEARYRFLVLEAEPTATPWTRRTLRQADRVLLLADATTDPQIGEIEARRIQPADDPTSPRRDLVLLHPRRTCRPTNTRAHLALHTVTAHHHIALDSDAELVSLARRLTGRAVGVVLGSGGARGFAHIGVLRALREAKVPIDVIGGTSAGAIVAGLYADGWDEASMIAWGRKIARRGRQLVDFTLPVVSFLAARRFNDALVEMFGDQRIEDLWRPYFCVSSNLRNAELMMHRQGDVWRAVRASCALPGVLPPLLHEGALLADGVILDNLPIERVSQICDGGPVVAVDVSSDIELNHPFSFEPAVSGLQVLWQRFRPFNRERMQAPSILSVMSRAAELSSVRTRLDQARKAALYINPPVSQFGLFELRAIDRMIEIGYQTAHEQIGPWLETNPY